ncbi:MAG: hypothetical protein Q8858_17370, partial [Bacteroidota bacterium]|nr:hypothetical protein [Bacteroidota bacterium]
LFPETSSSPASSSPEHLGPIQAIDLNRPGSQQEDLNIPPLEVFRTATSTETSALLEKTSQLFSVPKKPKKGDELRDSESDSDGIKFKKEKKEVNLETAYFEGQEEGAILASPIHEDALQDGLPVIANLALETDEKALDDNPREYIEIDPSPQSFLKKQQSPGPLIPDFLKKKFILKNQKTELPDSSIVTLEDEGSIVQTSFFDDFPPEDKAMLIRIAQQDLEGKTTCAQKWAIGGAVLISGGFAVAMWPLFNGGLVYLRDVYKWPILTYYFKSNGYGAVPYIMLSALCDAFPRNLTALKKAAKYVEEERINKWRVGLTGVASIFPSLQKASCLILFELYLMNRTDTHGWENQFAGAMLGLGPFLLTDSLISNYHTLWGLGDDMEEWVATSSSPFAKRLYPYVINPQLFSEKDTLKELHLNRLASFRHSLYQRSPEDINEIYDAILNARSHIQRDLPELDADNLDAAHAFSLLRYLIWAGDEKSMEKPKKLISNIENNTIGLVLSTGSPFRLLASQLFWETACSLVCSPTVAKGLGWGIGGIAFLVQTLLEYKGMKNYIHNYIGNEDEETQSYLTLRGSLKALCSFQGFMFTTVLAALCVQVCDRWFPNLWYLIGAIPYVLAEYAVLTNSYNNTYNKQGGTAALDVHNQWTLKKLGKKPTVDYKREYILRMSKQSEVWLKKLPHFVHEKLQGSLMLPKDEYAR